MPYVGRDVALLRRIHYFGIKVKKKSQFCDKLFEKLLYNIKLNIMCFQSKGGNKNDINGK